MESKEFDDILKNKLSSLQGKNLMPDWDRMQRELHEDSLKDQAFDEQMKRKLEMIKVPKPVAQTWNNLYERIDRKIRNKQSVYISKSSEIVLVLLLVFTLFNIGILSVNTTNTKLPIKNTLVPQTFASSETNFENKKNNAISKEKSVLANSLSTFQSKTENSTNQLAENISENIFIESIYPVHVPNIQPILTKNNPNVDKIPSLIAENSALLASQNINVSRIGSEMNQEQQKADISGFQNSNTKTITTLGIDPILNPINLDLKVVQSKNKFDNFYVSIHTGYQFNTIKSDVNESISNNRSPTSESPDLISKTSSNLDISAEIGYDINNTISVASGVGYQNVSYSPNISLTTGDLLRKYKETNINNINYEFINVPLNVNFKLFSRKSWKAEIQSGLVANILLRSKEYITQYNVLGNRKTSVSDNQIDLSELEYNFRDGILDNPAEISESQKLINSTLFKTNIGIGIYKKVSPKSSLFFKSNYLFQIPFLNNNNEGTDVINSYYTGIGLRYNLG